MKKLRVRRGAQTTGEANWGNKFYRAGYLLEKNSRFYLIQDKKNQCTSHMYLRMCKRGGVTQIQLKKS